MRTQRVAAIVACALLVASCGSRLSADERAEVLAQGDGTGSGTDSGAVDGGDTGTGDDVATGDDTGTGADSGSDAGTGSDGGSGTDGGSGGDDGGGSGGGALAAFSIPTCKSSGKASDTGVTGDLIKIGNVSTIGGPVPGFGQTGRNGARAFIAMVNASGGVCGRNLELLLGDDRLDAGANKSETERLVKQVFGFAGNTTVTDDGGAGSLDGAPDASLSISDARIKAPTNFSPNPIDLADGGNGGVKTFQWFKDNKGVKTGAVVYPAQASARARALGFVQDMERAGIDVKIKKEVGITETNYSGFAADVANQKIDLVITALEVNGMARLARAFQTENYFPKVPFYGAQAYGKKFLQTAGDAAEGTLIGTSYTIPEASSAAGPQAFKEWYTRVNPGADMDFFALQAWAATHMLVQAIAAAGPDPTREKVVAEMKKLTAFEGAGLMGKVNPAQRKFTTCFAVLGVKGGKWIQVTPKSGFSC